MTNKFLLFPVLAMVVCTFGASAQQKKVSTKAPSPQANIVIHQPAFQKLSEGRYSLTIHSVGLEIDANVGARVTSLTWGGRELLSQPEVNAINYGATFWTSPQKQWGWPPPAAWDKRPYQIADGGTKLELSSGKDSINGYAVRKVIFGNLADTSIHIRYYIVNQSDKARKVAPWEITRVPSGGLSFFPKSPPATAPPSTLAVKESLGIVWFDYDSSAVTANQKLFRNGTEGWLAHVENGIIIIKKFPDVTPAQVAPGEEEIELYANKEKTYVELEMQGHFQPVLPQASLTWDVIWYVRQLPAGIPVEVGSQALVDYVRSVVKRK
jgi:hypothetical protein